MDNILGYERDFIEDLVENLADFNNVKKGFILDTAWDCMMKYLDDTYENGLEYMQGHCEDIKDAGYKLQGYNYRTNIEYYLFDIVEDNIYSITKKVLTYTATKFLEKNVFDNTQFTGNLEEIIQQASDFCEEKELQDIENLIFTQIIKNISVSA